jgi:four helix bundle protein
MGLAKRVWSTTRVFPPEERFVLTQQLRRAALSVPANVAEDYGRMSVRDYLRFLAIANGSLKETETLLLHAGAVGLLGRLEVSGLLSVTDELGRVLPGLRRSLLPNR